MAIHFPKDWDDIEIDPDILAGYAADSLYQGKPQALARPRNEAAVQRILRFCHDQRIPVTPCGNQTSMTGASVGDEGLALSTEHLASDWQLFEDPESPGHWLVDAGPAIILSELQDALNERGFYYPPDPTSRREVRLGATVATNASGEDTYKYGATRAWIRGMTFISADGRRHQVQRTKATRGDGRKNTCGYAVSDSVLDLLIGSEGTLGVITRLTLEVIKGVPTFFSILFFFPDEDSCLEEVQRLHQNPCFPLRCLEYMDAGAVAILTEKATDLRVPPAAGAALYVKQEFEADDEAAIEAWCDYFAALYTRLNCPEFEEAVQFAGDRDSQARMREWRHLIPATMNERAARFRSAGGGKVGTDWYVPLDQMVTMFREVRRDQTDMPWVVFGHIGNGHPHFNFLARNAQEYQVARELLVKHCAMAVARGGGVSGEHGLGKLKSHLLACQYDETEIARMQAVKQQMDPHAILSPGNIFSRSAATTCLKG